jgi:pyruvate formate lyase activating enzyme
MHEAKKPKGIVFNLQRYSIHDGPGIRTTVFLKGCHLRCFWCQNPESQRKKPEVFFKRGLCTLCGRCVTACLPGASRLLDDGSIVIDRSKCTGCAKCTEVCPNGARSLMGRYWTVDEVMAEVLRDRRFYENSGGGVTLSGGEPSDQPRFALALLRTCKDAGLHTAIETCGYGSWPTMEKVLNNVDLVLFDIKHMDPKKHREATGKSNDTILENARRVARYKPMRVRVPVIPGFNDSVEEIGEIAHFVRAELVSAEIDLLPYNKLGESKYEFLDRVCFHGESNKEEEIQTLVAEVSHT